MVRQTKMLVMAGGTGGHVFPALAVAKQLQKQGVEVIWLGTRRGLEARLIPEAGIPIEYISVSGLRGKGMAGWLLAPIRLVFALVQAVRICLRQQPRAVLGMGGFVTGPGGVAAWLLRRPLVIQEQNAVAGLTNRLLSRIATRVLEAFGGSFPTGIKTEQTGNPVREDIRMLPEPEARFSNRQDAIRILVIGGSLGAQALNENVPAAIAELNAEIKPEIWHQAGRDKDVATVEAYKKVNVEARVDAFINDMAQAYAWADLVICRAGALTVSELTAAGLASILVPYPHAVDDHQTRNALYLADAGAARLVLQSEMTADSLARLLTEILQTGRGGLLKMAQRARRLARPHASQRVADVCLEVMHG